MAGLRPLSQERRNTPTEKSAVRNAGLRPAAAPTYRCRLSRQVASTRHFVSRAPKKNAPLEGPRTLNPTVSCSGPAVVRLTPQSANPVGPPCTADFLVGNSWRITGLLTSTLGPRGQRKTAPQIATREPPNPISSVRINIDSNGTAQLGAVRLRKKHLRDAVFGTVGRVNGTNWISVEASATPKTLGSTAMAMKRAGMKSLTFSLDGVVSTNQVAFTNR